MSRILLAWETCAYDGHVMRLATLPRELARRGHQSPPALRDLSHADALLGHEPLTVLQAPLWGRGLREACARLPQADKAADRRAGVCCGGTGGDSAM